MNHLLCRGRILGENPSLGLVYAGLYCSADPFRGVQPGETLQLGLSVAPGEGASRGYAYLPEAPLLGAAEIEAVQGLEYFREQKWFRVRADGGATGTGVIQLRIKDPVSARRIRPQMLVGMPDASGRKVLRTGKLSDEALIVLRPKAPGLRLVAEPGQTASVNVLAAVPAGSSAVSVTRPRHGKSELSYDGWVTYSPERGYTGWDRFEYTVSTPAGGTLSSHVNVLVGAGPQTPGVFPEQRTTAPFRPWQWPELTGEMPWPRPDQSAQNR
ncbi:Ig-like domain-containing protein [Streptomyces bambusae]|uniref:Ig-like domain-containing protein n=1 Tax=Streptomyces bambusae TaxID=1550616 RepID=UPI001CFCCEEF|nr:Ig-like domain-containing protein [Streptomyces bambusae]MCB5165547.1 Ig-like domain-containing protein [Streptomyces bambusae]